MIIYGILICNWSTKIYVYNDYPYFLSYANDYGIVYELSKFVIQFNKTFISYDSHN